MGTITATTIIDGAAHTLQDPDNAQWPRDELFGFVNDGQRDLCLVKPNAWTVNATTALAPGTKQAIPADGNQFVRFTRNMGPDGSTPGRAPRRIDLELLDRQDPNWHAAPASATVLQYGFDPADPQHFYVSPPQPDPPGHGELVYYGAPPDLADQADPIALDDVFKTTLEHYVIYRAYLKEGELQDVPAALAHRAEFLALLGVKNAGEQQGGG